VKSLTRAILRAWSSIPILVLHAACSEGSWGCPAKVADAVTLGPEWTELTPNRPLRSRLTIQELHLSFPPGHEVDFASGKSRFAANAIQFVDGRNIGFEGRLIDDRGNSFELGVIGISDGVLLSERNPAVPGYGPVFPQDRTYPKVRLRSSEVVQLNSVLWQCRSLK
jgi:hypothetical protein